MAAGIIAAVFGAAEAVLLKKTLGFFTSGEYTAAVAFALIKLLLYGAALPVLVFLFPAHIIECVIGYVFLYIKYNKRRQGVFGRW